MKSSGYLNGKPNRIVIAGGGESDLSPAMGDPSRCRRMRVNLTEI